MKATAQDFRSKLFDKKNLKIILTLSGLVVLLLAYTALRDTDTLITHKQANILYSKDKIKKVIVDGDYIHLKTDGGNYKIYKNAINTAAFFSKYPVEVKEDKGYIFDLLLLLILLGSIGYLFRMMKVNRLQQLRQIRGAREENAEIYEPVQALKSNVTFKDVAGIKDVKEELEEIIDFLREPQKYRDMDIRLPKGVLLVGPPGVGKTLISKAVAGEAGVPFFYQSGASFVHIYVGMGAKRVSELFKKAKQMAPSIIFIDEIDAVGKSRGEFRNDEREATLNQLLTEMDGFEESSGVIVIGATNKIDVLDEALLRAGRFDRRIHISLPDLEDRMKILELYLAHKPNNVDIESVARMTVGFNSAALDTLTNEAAIYAMREGRKVVENSDFEAVKEKVLLGKRKILSFTEEERKIQAVYQGAKAVVATWLDVEFEKIGIVTTRLSVQEHEILSRSKLINRIKVYLAGSIATKLHYNEQFNNAGTDIRQAKELLNKVIYDYWMSEDFIVNPHKEEELMREMVSEVTDLLKKLGKALSDVSEYLLQHENIDQEACRKILLEIF
ncbi:AAA family ATPase [Sulfurovum sp. NBC37-1]|uniref:AAA family ATPase n=1 Tax=Sulfurovum sp. (strain NBC37-1) TaxID=387093 RepID=UPI0001587822|nr:ATP-dependent metallopeptidase FtsH/Yme1/Tma family protein [Sulfurovum sp. NBC37-1]BAF71970.1 ATP-dependent zinc metalloproteinase [Sulfurovum sp. NBC37-1]